MFILGGLVIFLFVIRKGNKRIMRLVVDKEVMTLVLVVQSVIFSINGCNGKSFTVGLEALPI